MKQLLIDQVLAQIVKDVNQRDLTAIEELLYSVPEDNLKGFLSEVVDNQPKRYYTTYTLTKRDNNMFDYMLVEKELPAVMSSVHNGIACGRAIMCGTRANCLRYALLHGISATTSIVAL